jgi:upstream activation factor subunit UAF30
MPTKTAKRAATKRSDGGGRRAAPEKGKTRLNPALAKPVTPDEALSAIVGKDPLPRPQVIKKLWAYIKAERLQDPKEKRIINADDALKPVFGGKSRVDMFEMTKLVSAHVH